MHGALTQTEKKMLALEEGWFKYHGVKESQINELLHMSATRYYQVLNELIDRPEALAWAPLVVKRLQRLREARRAQRSAARLHALQQS